MNFLFCFVLLSAQASASRDKWECADNSERVRDTPVTRLKARELIRRVVRCKTPRLAGNVDAKGVVVIEVVVNDAGDVECLRAISGLPIIRGAAVEAAKQWKFKPLVVDRTAKPYSGFIAVYVSWDVKEMEKHCPQLDQPNSGVQRAQCCSNESVLRSAPADRLVDRLPRELP